jgi:very-short-patch-repair endonuclease
MKYLMSKKNKITSQIIDERLKEKSIKRLDNYLGLNIKIRLQCLKSNCNYIWITAPRNPFYSDRGCPKCGGCLKLTNEYIDNFLKDKQIKRLDNYINNRTKIKFQCLKCEYIWQTKPKIIVNEGSGCPKCAGLVKLTKEYIDQELLLKNIKRMGEYINSGIPLELICVICNHTWRAEINAIINKNNGCAKCAGNLKLSNIDIDYKLIDRNIKKIDDYINNVTPISFQCMICLYVWKASPHSITGARQSGCPICKVSGFNETLIFLLLKNMGVNFEHNFNIRKINCKETRRYRLDFYLPKLKLAIEYNGVQHYEPRSFGIKDEEKIIKKFVIQQNRDQYIRDFCKTNNVQLIEIDGRIFTSKKLERHIINIMKNFNIKAA